MNSCIQGCLLETLETKVGDSRGRRGGGPCLLQHQAPLDLRQPGQRVPNPGVWTRSLRTPRGPTLASTVGTWGCRERGRVGTKGPGHGARGAGCQLPAHSSELHLTLEPLPKKQQRLLLFSSLRKSLWLTSVGRVWRSLSYFN